MARKGIYKWIGIATVLSVVFVMSAASLASGNVAYISPEVVLCDGATVYVADYTQNNIKIITNDVLSGSIGLSASPTGITQDSTNLYVTIGGANSKLAIVNKATKEIEYINTNGHTSMAPVLKGNLIYTANRFSNTVSVIDITTKQLVSIIPTSREPIGTSLVGDYLYVASHLPNQKANPQEGEVVASAITIINTSLNTVAKTLVLNNGTIDIKAIAADGQYVYIPHVLARYMLPTSQLDRGWINTNALTIVDAGTNEIVTTVLLDDVDLGAANPWGVKVMGNRIVVSHSGTHEITIIDKDAMFAKIAAVKAGTVITNGQVETMGDIPNDISFMWGVKTRIKLNGNGARGVDIAENGMAYICEYFSGTISKVDLNSKEVTTISLGDQPTADKVRKGEMYWNDGTQCFQQWQSCISCHPDGRVDGLNWDNLNDGLGNPKNTKSMLFSHQTPPVMITGIRPNAETAVRAGMKFIQFNVLPEDDLKCIDEYLKAMNPVESPRLVNGQYSEKALRGKVLYDGKANCAGCHPSSNGLYTDLKLHNVGTNSEPEMYENRAFDTPSLIEVWRTGPYLADGRAATMTELLTTAAPGTAHDVREKGLTADEISDLEEYVMSISTVDETVNTAFQVTAINITNDTNVATVTLQKISQYSGAAKIIVAIYEGNALVRFKMLELPTLSQGETKTMDVNLTTKQGNTVKAFIWDGYDKMSPLSNSKIN